MEPCPPLKPGRGNVVTGRFVHRASGDLVEVELEDSAETIVATPEHRFWSPAHGRFAELHEFAPGDLLATTSGVARVRSLRQTPGDQLVYNLEVHCEHVYRIGKCGVLVHNNYGNQLPNGGTYKLRDANGNVARTGSTRDLGRREAELARHPDTKDLDFEIDRRTNNYAAQRGREQIIYDQHPEAQLGNGGLNRIRPISPLNDRIDEYLAAGAKL